MKVVLNGEPRDVRDGMTIAELVTDLGRDPARPGVAVAIGDEVVRRASWHARTLAPGDRVEVVAAVQGGSR